MIISKILLRGIASGFDADGDMEVLVPLSGDGVVDSGGSA
jgi:hypothetical protein